MPGIIHTVGRAAMASLLLAAAHSTALAQKSTVYATVVSSKLFVVGAANPRTGLHFQTTGGDTLWDHTGPRTSRVFDVAFGPGTDGRVIYLAAGNGVHLSRDFGASWRITTGWDITEVLSVSPDPLDTSTVYAATAYGVCKTTDGCRTWRKMNTGLTRTFTGRVLVDHTKPSTVYCGGERGLYISTNGGERWTRSGLSVGQVLGIAQHPTKPEVLLVGTEEHGLYRSTDGGRTWTKSEAGVDHRTFYAIAFDPSNPEIVYAGGYVTGVYKSTDGGVRWSRVNEGLGCRTIHALAVDPRDSNTVYAGGYWGGLFRTHTAGERWEAAGLAEAQVWNIMFRP